jgi:hypothetical protein
MADLSALGAYQNSMNNPAMKNLYDILGNQDSNAIFSGGTAKDQASKIMEQYNEKMKTDAKNTDKSEVDAAEGAKTKTAADLVGAADKLYTYGAELMQNAKNAEGGQTIGAVSAAGESGKSNLAQNIKDFVSNYNNTLDEAKAGSKNGSITNGDAKKVKNLLDTTSAYEKKLAEMGITIGSDNKLSINMDKLNSASTDLAKELFSGSKSFGANVLRRADSLTGYTATSYNRAMTNAYGGRQAGGDDSGLADPTSPVATNASETAPVNSTPGAATPAEEAGAAATGAAATGAAAAGTDAAAAGTGAAAGTEKTNAQSAAAATSATKQPGYTPPRGGGYDPIAEAERRAAERAEAGKVKLAAGIE